MDKELGDFIYDKFPNLDSNKTKHQIGSDYFISVFHDYFYNKFNRFTKVPNNNIKKCLLYFNSEKISKETLLERLFWDLAEFIEDTDIIEDICQKISCVIPSKKNPSNSEKKSTHPPKNSVCIEENDITSINFQYEATYFDKGKITPDTLSSDLREDLRKYKRDIYSLMKVKGNYFHNLHYNFYFGNEYLFKLKESIKELKFDFITLRFSNEKLIVKFTRSINNEINCNRYILDVLDDFISIGMKELYIVLSYYNIRQEDFATQLRAKRITQYHLAKDINCNIETEHPELLNRLRLNQDNDMESLGYIGLKNHYHYIDYSNGFAEYEILLNEKDGKTLAEIKRDLKLLGQDISPPQQTLDKYIDKNNKSYNTKFYVLLKGYLPINEFSIEPNIIEKNGIAKPLGTYNEITDLYNFNLLEMKTKNIRNHNKN